MGWNEYKNTVINYQVKLSVLVELYFFQSFNFLLLGPPKNMPKNHPNTVHTLIFMRKHYLSIGHFFKNAQSIEEKYEFSFDNFKTTQSIEIACIYLHASILNWLGLEIYPINWECLHIPINKHSLLIGYFLESNSFGATRYMPNKLRMLAYTSKPAFSID